MDASLMSNLHEHLGRLFAADDPDAKSFQDVFTILGDYPTIRQTWKQDAPIVDFRDRLDWWIDVIVYLHEYAHGSKDLKLLELRERAVADFIFACTSNTRGYWISRQTADDALTAAADHLWSSFRATKTTGADVAVEKLLKSVFDKDASETYHYLSNAVEESRHGAAKKSATVCKCCSQEICFGEKKLIRVFYATTRDFHDKSSQTAYDRFTFQTNTAVDKLHLESEIVSVPWLSKVGALVEPVLTDRPMSEPDWHLAGRCKYFLLKPGISTYPDTGKFITAMQDPRNFTSGADDKSTVLVFIHGINCTLAESMTRAAQLFSDCGLRGTPLVLSWPASTGGRAKWFPDWIPGMDAATKAAVKFAAGATKKIPKLQEWTKQHFASPLRSTPGDRESTVKHFSGLLRTLALEKQVDRIVLVAHSFGCKYALEIMEVLEQENVRLDGLVLAAPAVKVEDFKKAIKPLVASYPTGFGVYTDENDIALDLFKAGKLGEPAGARPKTIADAIECVELSNLAALAENRLSDPRRHMQVSVAHEDLGLLLKEALTVDQRRDRHQNNPAARVVLLQRKLPSNSGLPRQNVVVEHRYHELHDVR
jgi:pimeloyl-ACP methyl ester carboxylesterase